MTDLKPIREALVRQEKWLCETLHLVPSKELWNKNAALLDECRGLLSHLDAIENQPTDSVNDDERYPLIPEHTFGASRESTSAEKAMLRQAMAVLTNTSKPKFNISKEWCEKAAKAEIAIGVDVAAGVPDTDTEHAEERAKYLVEQLRAMGNDPDSKLQRAFNKLFSDQAFVEQYKSVFRSPRSPEQESHQPVDSASDVERVAKALYANNPASRNGAPMSWDEAMISFPECQYELIDDARAAIAAMPKRESINQQYKENDMTGETQQEHLYNALMKLNDAFQKTQQWTPEASNWEKTLVAGNLNGFCGFLSRQLPAQLAKITDIEDQPTKENI